MSLNISGNFFTAISSKAFLSTLMNLTPEAISYTTRTELSSDVFNSSPIICLSSTPRQLIEEIPSIAVESTLRRDNIPLVEIESTTPTTLSSPTSTGWFQKNKESY